MLGRDRSALITGAIRAFAVDLGVIIDGGCDAQVLPMARYSILLPAIQPRGGGSASRRSSRACLLRRRVWIAIGAQHTLEFAKSHEVAMTEPGRLVARTL